MRKVIFAVGVMLLFTTTLRAEEAIGWKTVGNWDILVDKTLGNGCFMYTLFENGSGFRLGFNPARGNAYVILGDEQWLSIEEGKDYLLILRLDRHPPWNSPATGIKMVGSDHPFLWVDVPVTATKFFNEMARSHTLSISYEGQEIARLSLRGSYAAVIEMIECQRQLNNTLDGRTPARDDPFAPGRTRRRGTDPFAR